MYMHFTIDTTAHIQYVLKIHQDEPFLVREPVLRNVGVRRHHNKVVNNLNSQFV